MVAASSELILAMMDTKMLFVTQVNQAVISSPSVGVDYALHIHLSSNDGLQSSLGAIRHDFGVDFATSLQNAKDRSFSRRSSSSPSPDSSGAEIRFINFNLPFEGGLFLTQFGNSLPDQREVTVNCVPVKTGESSDFGGIQIKGEALD